MGRPSSFTPELAAKICERLAAGESLLSICKDDDMPNRSTVQKWVVDDVQGFSGSYARARDTGLDVVAEEVIAIADEEPGTLDNGATDSGFVAHKRLRFDARRWYLSKLAPKKYGERSAMELTGADGGPVQITETERAAKVAAILAAAKQRQEDGDVSDLV